MSSELITMFGSLCLEAPLYSQCTVPTDEQFPVEELFKADLQFDAHCIFCDKSSAFRMRRKLATENNINPNEAGFPSPNLSYFRAAFYCVRQPEHLYAYFFHHQDGAIKKVGQSPSLEDIAANDILPYKSVLGKKYFSELHRASGLASHGIGIGSFVYLRRIFERLIEDHRKLFEASAAGPIETFSVLRMADKIEALKTVLPPTVVKYREMYGILSKGIHELSEEECKEYFPVLKSAIMSILEQDLQERLKRQKEKQLEAEMQRILSTLNGNGGYSEISPKLEKSDQ